MPGRRKLLWWIPAILYVTFFIWYTNFGGPLSDAEIDAMLERFEAIDATPDQLIALRQFMMEDRGGQFVMINLLDLKDNPKKFAATGVNAGAGDLLDYYMEHMYPELLSRASHPAFFGKAIFDAMDLQGIKGAETWDQAALFRYRSRRDLMEIASNPAFVERHKYKIAALEKTIAFPIRPWLFLSDLRLILGLLTFSIVSFFDLLNYRRWH